MSKYDGKWLVPEIPPEFNKILKAIGYNKVERHIFKKSKTYIHSNLEEDVLTIRVESSVYSKTQTHKLTHEPVEYQDDKKNTIIEISGWGASENVIQTKTIFPHKEITLDDTRELLEDGNCLHKLTLMKGFEEPIECSIIYQRVTSESK